MDLAIKTHDSNNPPLVFLHGWGFHAGIWDETAAALRDRYNIVQVDLPGHGHSPFAPFSLDSLARQLAAQLPDNALWVGWSLGGLVALHTAIRYPRKVRALVLVAATPRFVQGPDWPHAMQAEVLAGFGARLHGDYQGTLQRFLALQVKDGEQARVQLRTLKQSLAAHSPHAEALSTGLTLLAESDLRAGFAQLTCPVQLITGARDALVPAAVAADCRALLPGLETCCIAGASHIPFLSHPAAFLEALRKW